MPIVSVGFGSDYDGIRDTPVGLEDVSKYPALVRVPGLIEHSAAKHPPGN